MKMQGLCCSKCSTLILLLFYLNHVGHALSGRCPTGSVLELPTDSKVKNGSLVIEGVLYESVPTWNDGSKHYVCECDLKPCFRKCPEEVLRENLLKQISNKTMVQIGMERNEEHLLKVITLLDEYIDCHLGSEVYFNSPGIDDYILSSNGELIFLSDNQTLNSTEFCIGDTGENATNAVLLCGDETPHHHDLFRKLIFTLTMISTVMLFLNFIVIVLTNEFKSLYGKNLACMSITLMAGLAGLTFIALTGHTMHKYVCKIAGYATYFFMLSSFFWLNAMCFDIFLSIRNLQNSTRSRFDSFNRRFLVYSVYSTLSPFVFCVIAVICDNTLTSDAFLYPGFGVENCWFRHGPGVFVEDIFFHGLVFVLMTVNIVFTAYTVYQLKKLSRNAGHDDRQKAMVHFKLFFLMGATWLFEPISAWCLNEPNWFFWPMDVINASKGIFIFILCVIFNPRVRNSIIKPCNERTGQTTSSSNTGVMMQDLPDNETTSLNH
ncbi:G-protein coupled receptor Mth2-like [Cloeon dipterum]|uniref:G-protein coupled receptor Mth2-like n=1 Tax=Cloeon dipterum TaxID=197152 RepID=UPI00321FEBC7